MRLALSVLVLGIVLAGCSGKDALGYPDAYLLASNEIPSGLVPSDPLPGIPSNPGRVPDPFVESFFAQYGPNFSELRPREAWVQFLERPPADGGGGFLIAAGHYAETATLDEAVETLKSESGGLVCVVDQNETNGGFLLRDDNVLVLVTGDTGALGAFGDAVMSKLQSKVSALREAC